MSSIDVLQLDRIRRNYAGGDLSCEELLYLLEHLVSSASSVGVTELAELLAAVRHCNLRAHGLGVSGDPLHYTVFAAGRGFHLRQTGADVSFDISPAAAELPFLRGGSRGPSSYRAVPDTEPGEVDRMLPH